ncbi:MAG: hypothetical protein DCF15_15560 [Phormidesmis priestleyi]|uniref:Uncharacterized protein n=1 Tax=Phormidesmis priestleyi TaxID=268141 RepID=A0A2W4X028_9CYAN|nr:MAG: hypothetical protein DCF15_15560 [Phormidesmis priestleyi]
MSKFLKDTINECLQDLVAVSQMKEFAWGIACGFCSAIALVAVVYFSMVCNRPEPNLLKTIPAQERVKLL